MLNHILKKFLAPTSMSFEVKGQIDLPLGANDCPEYFGDQVRILCKIMCAGQWRQIDRSDTKAVHIQFEQLDDQKALVSAISNGWHLK